MPSELSFAAFFGIDELVDGLLTGPWHSTLEPHPPGDLLRRPAGLQTNDHSLAQVRIANQLSMARPAIQRQFLSENTPIARQLGEFGIVVPVSLQLSKHGRAMSVALIFVSRQRSIWRRSARVRWLNLRFIQDVPSTLYILSRFKSRI